MDIGVNQNMSSKNERKKKVEIVSRILSSEGFEVTKDYKIGDRFYVDIVGTRGNQAVLVEVKPSGFKLDQSDLMQVSSYVSALRRMRRFGNTNISGFIIASGGTISLATPLISELGIHVIKSDEEKEIERGIKRWMRATIL